MFKTRLARRIFIAVFLVAIMPFLLAIVVLGGIMIEHSTSVSLPRPTGPFAVGRVIFDWSDPAAVDALAPVPATIRELLVWIWYPAMNDGSAVAEDYLPAASRAAVERARGTLIGKFLTRDLAKVRAHSLRNCAFSPQQPPYPIIILRAGASLEVWNYTSLAEDLASHGYVVVGIDAPYRTNSVAFPDGRVMQRLPQNNPEHCLTKKGEERDRCVYPILSAWIGDIRFVVQRLRELNRHDPAGKFEGKLDMMRVGILGHSFGGAQAAQFCHDDPACKAGIDLDGAPMGSVVEEGLSCPFMFLLSDHIRESDPDSNQIKAAIRSIYDRLPTRGRACVMIRGANHFTFTDDGALLKSGALRGVLRVFGRLKIDGRRQLAITSYCIHTFFDACLKHRDDQSFKVVSPLFPELADCQ